MRVEIGGGREREGKGGRQKGRTGKKSCLRTLFTAPLIRTLALAWGPTDGFA